MIELDAIAEVFGREIGGKALGELDDYDWCAGNHHRKGSRHIIIGTTKGVGICLDEPTIRAIVRLWRKRAVP